MAIYKCPAGAIPAFTLSVRILSCPVPGDGNF